MKLNFKLIYSFLIGALLMTACSKEEIMTDTSFDAQEDLVALEQELLTIEQWEDIEDELQNGKIEAAPAYLLTPDCVEKTWEVIGNNSRKLTIDFGEEPCLGVDGLYRRGVIAITYTGPRGALGASRLTEFIDYFVMNIQFNGDKLIETTGPYTYSREVDMNKKVGDKTSSWSANQIVEKISGYATTERDDDIFQVIGTGDGVRQNGMNYSAEITAPLLRKILPGCYQNFVDGTVLFINENEIETLLDYDPIGGAPCDKLAAISRNGNTHFITLW